MTVDLYVFWKDERKDLKLETGFHGGDSSRQGHHSDT